MSRLWRLWYLLRSVFTAPKVEVLPALPINCRFPVACTESGLCEGDCSPRPEDSHR
jgi:hypothetical protein